MVLAATHARALDYVSLGDLREHAVDADEADAEAAEARRDRSNGRGDGPAAT